MPSDFGRFDGRDRSRPSKSAFREFDRRAILEDADAGPQKTVAAAVAALGCRHLRLRAD